MERKKLSKQNALVSLQLLNQENGYSKTLYSISENFERTRITKPYSSLYKRLDALKDEILIRVKITKREIFMIGDLLVQAKQICLELNLGFQEWIEESFDFSYETAKNYMNVFRNCLAYRRFVDNVPISILYNVASPSFPEEIREHMLTSGSLNGISNKMFGKLKEKYKTQGVEAIEEDITQINRGVISYDQVQNLLDLTKSEIQTMEELSNKINQVSNSKLGYEPEIKQVLEILLSALNVANKALSDAEDSSKKTLKDYANKLQDLIR